MTDFSTIYNPYNAGLNRVAETRQSSDSPFSNASDNNNSSTELKSLDDAWVGTWIKSKNYKPKRSGWMLDGQSGKVEINDVTHFGGMITIENLGEIKASDLNNDLGWTNDAALNLFIGTIGNLAYKNLVSASLLDTTVISGGYIKTSLLTANNIITGTLTGITVQTGTLGKRIVMESNTMKVYDGINPQERVRIDSGQIWLNKGTSIFIDYESGYIAQTSSGLEIGSNDEGGGGSLTFCSYNNAEAIIVYGNFLAGNNVSWGIGSPEDPFGDIHLASGSKIYVGGVEFSASVNGINISPSSVTVNGNIIFPNADGHGIQVGGYWAFAFSSNNTIEFLLSMMPNVDGANDLGNPALRINSVFTKYVTIYGTGSTAKSLSGDETTMTVNSNFSPSSANSKYCGTASNWWARVYSDAYFTHNTVWQQGWDKYDDLQVIRDLKTFKDKNRSTGYGMDISSLPKELFDEDFVDFGGMQSFSLCAMKKIVECIDSLKMDVDDLKAQLFLCKD